MASLVEQVMNLACCSKEDAQRALANTKNNVIDAVDMLLDKPVVKGETFLPPKPTINDGLTEEVRNKIKQVRELAEILNAGARAAETKRTQERPVVQGAVEFLPQEDLPVEVQVPGIPSSERTEEGNPAGSS